MDTKRPTATIVVADSVLSAGETSLVTITFSEAVTSFTLADLTAANGTISGLSSGDGGVTWTATFTPAALTTAPSNVITLVNTGVLDAASNNGSGSTNSNNYAVVTAGPTNTITVADSSLTVGESTLVTFTFSEAVTGFDNADISVPNGTLGNVSSVDGITYTATFTPTAGITSAANMITVDNTGVLGGGGSAGAGTTASNSFAIDTLRPSATIAVADNALKVGETSLVTITFTEPVSGFDNSDLTVANGTLSAVGSVDGGITWTATFTPTAGIADTSNLITLNQATLVDAAGNAGSGSASSNNYAIDTAPPTVTIVVADNALASGETSLVTFTFSEPVTGFTNADLSVANGTLSAVATLDGGQTWTATFTPTASTTDASNLITLSNTGVLDAAGNAGIGATSSNNYAIDNVRPTATIVVADTMLLAGETSLVTITFSEVVTGFALSTAGGSISGVTSADGGMTWTGTFTPTANIDDASNLITLDYTSVTDAAGNEGSGSTASNNYEIATKRPTVAIVVADGTLTAGETSLVTFTFSEPVSGFSNADLTVASGTLSPVSSSDGGITWTATFTPTALTTDTSNVITVANGGLLDASGNAGSGSTDSNNYAVLTAGPTATIVVADTALAAGESTLVTFTFSLPATGFDNADISVSNGTLSAVSSTDGGITWTATFTPTAGVNSPANLITLDNTGVFSSGGSPGTGTTSSNSFAIETTLPDATIVVADGALNFGETSLVTITFTEPVVGFDNADLTVANGTLSAVGSIDGGVTWTATFTPTAGITDTSNLVTLVKAGLQDAAGNAGTGSASSNNYAIDTARPSVTIVVADSALAAGETALVTFMFSEPVTGFSNADLAIANGSLGAVNSSDGGLTWSATFTPAADTTDTGNLITLANGGVFDLAGNAGSGTTDSNNFGIDTARPSATIVVADGALAAGETSLVTITFSEAVTGLTNTDLAIANGGLGALASSDGGITWTATFTPAANVTDTGNLITLNNAGVADLAGNLGAGSTDSNNYAIDTARPTVAIVVADSALSIGETTLVTFTFSEAVAGFTNADLTVANGALGAVASIDGGLTWTATFTPTANLTDTSNLVTLNNTGVADLAGNIGAGSTDSNNYSIDTARPTVGIVVADSALSAGESTLVTFTFSEAVTGFTNADLTVANGILGAVSTSNGGITWTATFTPNANVTDTTNLLTLANTGILDQAGNAGAGSTDSNNYAIDTARPTAAIVVADTALSVGESTLVTFTFSEAVAGFTNADLTVANGSLGPVASTDGGITWTATFTPSANVTDTSNLVTLNNSGVTDLAGNAGAGSTVSNYYAIDTMRPTAVITVADGALFVGETSLVTITFSEAVSGFTNADLAVANGALGAVSSSDGGLTWSATFTPTANVADASNLITLANAGVQDAAGNAGAGATDSNNYAIDTVPAATPGAPQLAAASDSGSSNSDRITNDNTPTITGSAADGTTVTLYDSNGVTVLGTAVASGGLWSITSSALSDGNHTLTAIATKGGFNASARSSGLQVTIDTIAPAAPGRPATADGSPLTHNRTPVFNGAGAEANAVITIRNGASAIGTAQADASGNWTSAPIALANGSYQITASATDAAGNTSAPSEVRALRIAAPPQPVDPRPPHAEHDDSVFSDAITGFDDQFASIGEGIASPFERSPLGATIDAAMGRGNGEGSGDGTFRLFDLGTATGGSVVFTLPANLFGGRELVSIRATLPGGQPLPLWLHFDAASRTFSGELPVGALSFITVELVAVDKDGKELRATLTLGGEPAADGQPAQNQSGMSGLDLLKALGIKGLERGDQATPQAAPRETDTAAHARHLSGQLDKQAQRFARGSDATMRHLEQIEQKNIARPHA
ncbi:MAG: Ig-like domain-containing protein [Pseudomonadota bacterium]